MWMCKYFSLHKFNLLDTGCLLFLRRVWVSTGLWLMLDIRPRSDSTETLAAMDVKTDSARTPFCTEKLKHSTIGTRWKRQILTLVTLRNSWMTNVCPQVCVQKTLKWKRDARFFFTVPWNYEPTCHSIYSSWWLWMDLKPHCADESIVTKFTSVPSAVRGLIWKQWAWITA